MAKTVLICDDAAHVRRMLTKTLERAGYEVVGEAETGGEAVDRYRELRPDLVVMDIVMPEVDGIEAVRRITAEFPDARILMCSAMGQQALISEAVRAGAREFLVKPFEPSSVIKAIERVLA